MVSFKLLMFWYALVTKSLSLSFTFNHFLSITCKVLDLFESGNIYKTLIDRFIDWCHVLYCFPLTTHTWRESHMSVPACRRILLFMITCPQNSDGILHFWLHTRLLLVKSVIASRCLKIAIHQNCTWRTRSWTLWSAFDIHAMWMLDGKMTTASVWNKQTWVVRRV